MICAEKDAATTAKSVVSMYVNHERIKMGQSNMGRFTDNVLLFLYSLAIALIIFGSSTAMAALFYVSKWWLTLAILIVMTLVFFAIMVYAKKKIESGEFDAKTIKVKYLRDILPIKEIENGDWIDLRCGKDIVIKAGESRLIPLGVAIELPKGYEAHLAPRSSTFKNFGILLVNGVGVIDESYRGDGDEWFFHALAFRDTKICKNDRICQFRIVKKMPKLRFKTVLELGNKNRHGHGSTGLK